MDEGTGTRRFAFAGDERSLNKDHDYPGGVDRIKSNIIMSDDFCEPFSPPVFFFFLSFQILKNRSPKE